MRAPHALASLPVAALLLSGCAADPADDRRAQVAAVIDAANAGDADRLRDEAGRLVETVTAQQERQDVAADEADRLITLAEAVRTNADVIDEELLEQRRREAEAAAEAERKRLEEERQRLEADRKQLEEDRKEVEEEDEKRGEEGGKKKGRDKDDD